MKIISIKWLSSRYLCNYFFGIVTWTGDNKKATFFSGRHFFKVQNCKEKTAVCSRPIAIRNLHIVIDPSSLCGIWISCDSRFCLGKYNNSNTNYHPWLPRCGGFYRHFFVDPRIYKSHILVWPLTGNEYLSIPLQLS